jgi:beta-N-acetylhexosaminidase
MSSFGPVMMDISGEILTASEKLKLQDPRVGGLILFTRNYRNRDQLKSLVSDIRSCRPAPILIAVDHEGGRVQRFREGFSALPAMATLGALYVRNPEQALVAAQDLGFVLAHELLECGLDFSFTPVLDLDFGNSSIIGHRAFSSQPERVALLAGALMDGLEEAGSCGIGKHFPGHGYVRADSHLDLPIDDRAMSAIEMMDLVPFKSLSKKMRGVMPAHVLYEKVDSAPAGFSPFWLQDILRGQCGFDGAIFSDDLAMVGALGAGTPAQRAESAFSAGCDMVLLCNDPEALDLLLEDLDGARPAEGASSRLSSLQARKPFGDLAQRYATAIERLNPLALEGWAQA